MTRKATTYFVDQNRRLTPNLDRKRDYLSYLDPTGRAKGIVILLYRRKVFTEIFIFIPSRYDLSSPRVVGRTTDLL